MTKEQTPVYYHKAEEEKRKDAHPSYQQGVVFPDIVRLQAYIINRFQVFINWEVHPDHIGAFSQGDYSYTIYRNDLDERSTADEVSPPLPGIEEFIDTPQSVQSKWRQIYYWVKVTHISGESIEIGPARVNEGASLSQMGRSIVQRLILLLRNYPVGTPAFIYPQRQWGTRCPQCWNPIRGKSDDSDCSACLGTGWLHPYAEIPFETYVALSNSLEGVNWKDSETEPDDRNIWTVNVPPLKKRDLVYIPAVQRLYRVKACQWMAQESGVAGIKQGALLTPVLVSDPEHSQFSGDRDLDRVRVAMKIIANQAEKTYFGGRDGGTFQTPGMYRPDIYKGE